MKLFCRHCGHAAPGHKKGCQHAYLNRPEPPPYKPAYFNENGFLQLDLRYPDRCREDLKRMGVVS